MYNNWNEHTSGYEYLAYINEWMDGELFATICKDAMEGDEDSEEVIEKIQNFMENVHFHLENKSPQKRINLELNSLKTYIELFV
jgi:hypothetical protein